MNLALETNRSRRDAIESIDPPQQLRSARPDQACDAQNLSPVQGQLRILHSRSRVEPLHFDQFLALVPGNPWIHLLEASSDHLADQFLRGCIGDISLSDHLAISQHGPGICHALYLFEEVGDVDHRTAILAQPIDHLEQVLDILCTKATCRFIEYDDGGIVYQSSGDLDELSVSHRQPCHCSGGLDIVAPQKRQ